MTQPQAPRAHPTRVQTLLQPAVDDLAAKRTALQAVRDELASNLAGVDAQLADLDQDVDALTALL